MSFTSDFRAVVRHRDFRRLYVTRLTSQASDGVFQVALASYVFFDPSKHTSAEKVAGAFAALLLPYSLVGPFAGVFLDRWRRRQVLVWANVVRAGLVATVAGLIALDVENALFYLMALTVLSVNRFYLAALSAALPHVVTRHELVMANSVSTTSGTVAALAGAGAGFGARKLLSEGAIGDAIIVFAAVVIYLCASFLARRMAPDLLGPDFDPDMPQTREALRRVAAGLVDGARHIWHHRAAGHALAAIAGHRFYYGISTVATILLYRNHFNDPGDTDAGLAGMGMAFAASGIGFFLAALITPEVTPFIGTRWWVVTCYGSAAVVQLALGLPFNEPSLLAAALLLGIVAQGSKICVDTIVQESIDDAYRGRVFSFYDVLFNVSFVGAAAFASLVLPASGKSVLAVVIVSLGYALTAILYTHASRHTPDPDADPDEAAEPAPA